MALTADGIQYLLGGTVPTFTFIKEQWYLLPPLFLLVMFFPLMGPVAEEFGWRGYALPRLQEKWGPLIASLAIGTAWGLWHLPEFFTPGTSQYVLGIGLLVPFTISEIANSIFMTWVYNKTKESLLIGGLMAHTAMNFLGTLLITEVTAEAFTEGAVDLPDTRLILLLFGIMTLVALVLVIVTKGRLGYSAKDEDVCSPGQV
jgi:membrane protease YdiL (CAAX protease family)